jgi:hypothetical protein
MDDGRTWDHGLVLGCAVIAAWLMSMAALVAWKNGF